MISSSSSFSRLLNDLHQHEFDRSNQSIDNESTIEESNDHRRKDLELSTVSTNGEIKEKGTVKWRIYLEYFRSGAGIICGLILLFILLSIREGTYVFSTWWLANWNEDENYRHHLLNNCTSFLKNNSIWKMTDQQWNDYRNHLFVVYSSKSKSFFLRSSQISLVAVGGVVFLTLFRNILLELIFINAARVLHNKFE